MLGLQTESGGMKRLPVLLLLWLRIMGPVSAAPTATEAKTLVDRIIAWSLPGRNAQKIPVELNVVSQNKSDFHDEMYGLIEWVSTPHPDAEGRRWHYEIDPLWRVQDSIVTEVKVGKPKPEGDLQLVVVDYISPSIRPSRPSTKHHNTWVVGQHDGKAVLVDIRYHAKYPAGVEDGSVLADMKAARSKFKEPSLWPASDDG